MITGRESGSGTYSYHKRSQGNSAVLVSHMPEDQFKVRIVFMHNGETGTPILKISASEAEMLWAALNAMAIDMKWEDLK